MPIQKHKKVNIGTNLNVEHAKRHPLLYYKCIRRVKKLWHFNKKYNETCCVKAGTDIDDLNLDYIVFGSDAIFNCRAIDLIIHNGRVGEVYNVGGHNEMKNIDIVKIICKELGKPESLMTHVTDRKGHDMRYAIDPTKIHNELGWLPETKFEDGIKKTIQWYLDNKEWWETIISGEYQNYYEKMYGNR